MIEYIIGRDQRRSACLRQPVQLDQPALVVAADDRQARELAALRQAAGAASPRDLEPMLGALGVALTGGRSQVTVLVRQFTDQPPPAKGGRFRLRGKWHVITGIRRMSPAGKVRTLAVSGVHFDELPGMASYTWDAAPDGYEG